MCQYNFFFVAFPCLAYVRVENPLRIVKESCFNFPQSDYFMSFLPGKTCVIIIFLLTVRVWAFVVSMLGAPKLKLTTKRGNKKENLRKLFFYLLVCSVGINASASILNRIFDSYRSSSVRDSISITYTELSQRNSRRPLMIFAKFYF